MRSHRSGFTLVELSVVLVIIGLLVGGILVGRDLIKAAEIRAVVSQGEQIKAAIAAFKGKFNCLPGDCGNASDFGFVMGPVYAGQQTGDSLNNTVNGNGDGVIGDPTGYLFDADRSTYVSEQHMFFWQLVQANMLSGTVCMSGQLPVPTCSPYGPFGFPAKIRLCAWQPGYSAGGPAVPPPPPGVIALGNVILLAGPNTACGFSTCGGAIFSEGVTPEEAKNIDGKVDDGMPNTGQVRAVASSNYIDATPLHDDVAHPNRCVDTYSKSALYASPATDYNTRCNLLFSLGV